ncbi:hypothetical protein BJX64DRAFT_29614 [Aspergillus heterothallicus]
MLASRFSYSLTKKKCCLVCESSAASYANSSTAFTPLALVKSHEYTSVLSQLAAEHYERVNLNRLYGDRDGSPSAQFKHIIGQLVSKLIEQIPYINHPYVEFVTGKTGQAYSALSTQLQSVIQSARARFQSHPEPPSLTLAKVEQTLTQVFEDLKASALADTGTTLTYAVIGVPDFFNETLVNLVVNASIKAGIETPSQALPRTLLTHFENPAVAEGSSVLVVHQGIHHCGLKLYAEGGNRAGRRGSSWAQISRRNRRNKKRARERESGYTAPTRDLYLPMDPWRVHVIHKRLAGAVVRSSPELQTQLELGADVGILIAKVVQARLELKRKDLSFVYVGEESRSADFLTTIGEEPGEDDFLEEATLGLGDWFVYGRDPGVTVTKKMVLDADEEYVSSLAKTIDMFARATQETEKMYLQMFDHIAILTDWVDGDLVRHALKQALGDDIPISGGSLRDVIMAADGAARLALIRRQNLITRREYLDFWHDEL